MSDALDGAVKEMIESTPEVTQGAIDQEMAEKQEKESRWSLLRDKNGDSFDPSKHVVKDGEPVLGRGDKLKLKPGARKQDNRVNVPSQAGAQQIDQQTRVLAYQLVDTMMSTCRMLWGEEWKPVIDQKSGIDERQVMAETWGVYLQSKGMNDIPPGLAVVLVTMQYVGPRLVQPQTKSKLAGVWGWIKSKIKKQPKKDEQNAQSDNRDNGLGEN